MKTKAITSALGVFLACAVLAFLSALSLQPALGSDPQVSGFTLQVSADPSPAILDVASVPATPPALNAAVVPPSPAVAGDLTSSKAAPVSAPWWAGTEVLSAVIALVTGLIAVWSHKEKKTALKVSESLILGIEAASKIPAVAEKEREIKKKIKEVTQDNGVGPVVAALVSRLT